MCVSAEKLAVCLWYTHIHTYVHIAHVVETCKLTPCFITSLEFILIYADGTPLYLCTYIHCTGIAEGTKAIVYCK